MRRLALRLLGLGWRTPLVLASLLLLACGPAASLGLTRLVELGSLTACALAALAVPLGAIALLLEEGES